MPESAIVEQLRIRRIQRMRLGQETAELESIPSSPGVRVALVPLTEKEYDQAQRSVAALGLDIPDNVAGAGVLDRQERREVIMRAIREPDDYSKRMFNSVDEMMEVLEPVDVTHLYDSYVEMAMTISPDLPDLSEEEIDFLKLVFENFQWKDISGRQLYALNRFILTLSPQQLMGKEPGSFLTKQ